MPDRSPDDTPLWDFSLAVYGAAGVAAECLDLQERLGLDVNLLLFAAFTGAVEGVRLDSRDVAAAAAQVDAWHGDIVRTLRGVRRGLKPVSLDAADPRRTAAAELRTRVKAAELAAEKIEQAMLWRWSRRQLDARPRVPRSEALADNLHIVLARFDGAGQADQAMALPRLRAAALAFDGAKG